MFQFGGKLVTFGKFASSADHSGGGEHGSHHAAAVFDAHSSARVTLHQVVTDNKLVENSHFLENALQTGNFLEYCNYKIEAAGSDQAQASIWRFIQVRLNLTLAKPHFRLDSLVSSSAETVSIISVVIFALLLLVLGFLLLLAPFWLVDNGLIDFWWVWYQWSAIYGVYSIHFLMLLVNTCGNCGCGCI